MKGLSSVVIILCTWNSLRSSIARTTMKDKRRIVYQEMKHSHFLENQLQRKQTTEKLKLLTQLTARDWGYQNPILACGISTTPEEYLNAVANFVLFDYDLTLPQKINSLKIRYILKSFKKNLELSEFEQQLIKADVRFYRKFGRISSAELNRYRRLEAAISKMALQGKNIIVDLLIHSFVPATAQNFSKDDQQIPRRMDARIRMLGTFALVNELLDPVYRLTEFKKYLMVVSPRDLQWELEKKVLANYDLSQRNETDDASTVVTKFTTDMSTLESDALFQASTTENSVSLFISPNTSTDSFSATNLPTVITTSSFSVTPNITMASSLTTEQLLTITNNEVKTLTTPNEQIVSSLGPTYNTIAVVTTTELPVVSTEKLITTSENSELSTVITDL